MIPFLCNIKPRSLPLSMISVTKWCLFGHSCDSLSREKQHGLCLVWKTLAFIVQHPESEPEHQRLIQRDVAENSSSHWELTSDTGFPGGQALSKGSSLFILLLNMKINKIDSLMLSYFSVTNHFLVQAISEIISDPGRFTLKKKKMLPEGRIQPKESEFPYYKDLRKSKRQVGSWTKCCLLWI